MSGRRFAPALRHFLFPTPLGERRLLGAFCALLRSAAFSGAALGGLGSLVQVFEKRVAVVVRRPGLPDRVLPDEIGGKRRDQRRSMPREVELARIRRGRHGRCGRIADQSVGSGRREIVSPIETMLAVELLSLRELHRCNDKQICIPMSSASRESDMKGRYGSRGSRASRSTRTSRNKDGCLRAALEGALARLVRRLASAAAEGAWIERVSSHLRILLRLLDDEPERRRRDREPPS